MTQRQEETINLITGRPEQDKSLGISILDSVANMTLVTIGSGAILFNFDHHCGVPLNIFLYLLFSSYIISIVLSGLFWMFRMKHAYMLYMNIFGIAQTILGVFALTQYYRSSNNCNVLAPELNFLALAYGWFIVLSTVVGFVKGIYIGSVAAIEVQEKNNCHHVHGP